MHGFRKRITSVTAMLLALLTIVSPQEAEAVSGINDLSNTGTDSGIAWSSELPNDGDMSYKTDKSWHRLVLEYGDYCTNRTDSNGDYKAWTPEHDSAWPDEPWGGSDEAEERAKVDNNSVTNYWDNLIGNWIGNTSGNDTDKRKVTFDRVTYGTKIRKQDQNLYANGEYSTDGMYSLYIKYAGLSHDTKEPCYYISPCDENGDRQDRIWALECCLDLTGADMTSFQDGLSEQMYYMHTSEGDVSTGNKAVCDGIAPNFNLVTPTPDEFDNLDNFKYAGIATSYYSFQSNYEPSLIRNRQKSNDGTLKTAYNDNNKWIITQNTEDGSWVIKSAGWCEWEWNDTSGDFCKMFSNADEVLLQAITQYIRSVSYFQTSNKKDRDYTDEMAYYIFERYYVAPWGGKTWCYYPKEAVACHLVPMLWLDEYVSNVYIVGSYEAWGTFGFNNNTTHAGVKDGKITAACLMKCSNN